MLKRFLGRASHEGKVFHLFDKIGLSLEIDPRRNSIAPKNKGFNVHILDYPSAAELRDKSQRLNINLDNIEEVCFIWHGELFQALIGKSSCYDWIIASHFIDIGIVLIYAKNWCYTFLDNALRFFGMESNVAAVWPTTMDCQRIKL